MSARELPPGRTDQDPTAWLPGYARALYEDQPDAVAIHHRGRVAYANRRLGALLGVEPAALCGRPTLELYPHAQRGAVLTRLQTAAYTGLPSLAYRHRLRHADGSGVDVEVSLLLVPLADDDPLIVEVFRPPNGA